jgi:O-antigen biosynthesis protein
MKVCFLLNDLALAGGVGVIIEHAHNLAADHDFDVTVAMTQPVEHEWLHRRLPELRLMPVEEAARDHFDVAVATWWRTAYKLFDIHAERYAYFVQSMEDRFYEDPTDRLLAAVTHTLPVAFITEARWIAETLAQLRPTARCFYVRNGIAKDVFAPIDEVRTDANGPLRILVEGHPDVGFKAVPEAIQAAGLMTRPRQLTLVTPAPGAGQELAVDRIVGPLSHEELAALYAETEVVLKLSRVEGMFGPPLEAFHRGSTCVVTPVTGHEEFVSHGWNGLVAGWDDLHGTARWLDLLADDRRLLHFLRTNAVKTAEAWPSWRQSSSFMAAALRAIRREPAPSPTDGGRQLLQDVLAGVESARVEGAAVRLGKQAQLEAEALKQTRAYRVGLALRRVWKSPPVRALTFPLRVAHRGWRKLRSRRQEGDR